VTIPRDRAGRSLIMSADEDWCQTCKTIDLIMKTLGRPEATMEGHFQLTKHWRLVRGGLTLGELNLHAIVKVATHSGIGSGDGRLGLRNG
jgi:hypothetical protein